MSTHLDILVDLRIELKIRKISQFLVVIETFNADWNILKTVTLGADTNIVIQREWNKHRNKSRVVLTVFI